jgi:putative oxidoreductase
MNYYLIVAGSISMIAALLHILIIFKGSTWYAFFHAGDKMVSLSKQGSIYPDFVTLMIAMVLFTWGLYAFSGAQFMARLPFLKPVLIIITSIYLLRGLAIIPLYFFFPEKADAFMFWSSVICLMIGLFYLLGIYKM